MLLMVLWSSLGHHIASRSARSRALLLLQIMQRIDSQVFKTALLYACQALLFVCLGLMQVCMTDSVIAALSFV